MGEEVPKPSEGNNLEDKHRHPTFLEEVQNVGEAFGDTFLDLSKKILNSEPTYKKISKKEFQATLKKETNPENEKVSKEELYGVLRLIAPGTNFRAALDNIVKGGRGAIIVVENESLPLLLDGGFRVNCRFTPQKLVELSKMDGAIVLSQDMKKIDSANVLLTPDSKIKTNETGTRHKAAERTAKQTGCISIAVSERRHEIVLFYKNIKHIVKYTAELLRGANEQIQILEKQRELFESYLEKLNRSELRNDYNINHAVSVIQKGQIVQKMADELKRGLIELGTEGVLLKTRLQEIVHNVEKETDLVVKDYSKIGLKKSKLLLETLSYEELLEVENIRRTMAYEKEIKTDNLKGWRILSKTSLQEQDIALLVKEGNNLGKIIHAEQEIYNKILGEEKAQQFKEEIERIKLNY